MSGAPREVEFEHRTVVAGAQLPSLEKVTGVVRGAPNRLMVRVRGFRVVFLVLSAAAMAFATQRAGLELRTAACLFFGSLPVLWILSSLLGLLWSSRRLVRSVQRQLGADALQREFEQATRTIRVKLALQDEGVELVREGTSTRVPWSRLEFARPDADGFFLTVRAGAELVDHFVVPRSAFESPEAFDGFCLELQRRLWEAQRG